MSIKTIILLILFLIIFLEIIVLILHTIGLFKTRVPFVSISKKMLPKISETLNLNKNSIVYDLGCGNGQVLRYLLKNNTGVSGVGIEIAPLPSIWAQIWQTLKPIPKMTILQKDFFSVNTKEATHIFLYLFPKVMDNLLPKLEKELSIGTRVVSCDFQFSNKKPVSVITVATPKERTHRLFVYEF